MTRHILEGYLALIMAMEPEAFILPAPKETLCKDGYILPLGYHDTWPSLTRTLSDLDGRRIRVTIEELDA